MDLLFKQVIFCLTSGHRAARCGEGGVPRQPGHGTKRTSEPSPEHPAQARVRVTPRGTWARGDPAVCMRRRTACALRVAG